MKKELLYHSFYIKQARDKTFKDQMFIYKIDDNGYHVYCADNPKGYKFITLDHDYEKYTHNLTPSDGCIKIVKHNQKTIIRKLKEIKDIIKEK